jgi:hypothetical protein
MNTVFHGCTLSWSFRELKLVFSAVAAAAASAASASTPSSISSASTVVLVEPTVPVAVLFVVCGKLAGQPQGWGDWFRRWRWRFEDRFGRRRRRCRNHTLQPRPLGCWLAHLARSRTFQLGGQESRRHSTPARWDVPKEVNKEQPSYINLSANATRVLQCTCPVAASWKYFSAIHTSTSPPHLTSTHSHLLLLKI